MWLPLIGQLSVIVRGRVGGGGGGGGGGVPIDALERVPLRGGDVDRDLRRVAQVLVELVFRSLDALASELLDVAVHDVERERDRVGTSPPRWDERNAAGSVSSRFFSDARIDSYAT